MTSAGQPKVYINRITRPSEAGSPIHLPTGAGPPDKGYEWEFASLGSGASGEVWAVWRQVLARTPGPSPIEVKIPEMTICLEGKVGPQVKCCDKS